MKKEDKVLVGVTSGLFFILVLVALVLWQKRKREESAFLDTEEKNTAPTYNYSSPTVKKDVAIKDAGRETTIYVQNSVNAAIDYLKGFNVGGLPERLVVDGVFGAKTEAALDSLFLKYLSTADASNKTLTELKIIIKNKGLDFEILA